MKSKTRGVGTNKNVLFKNFKYVCDISSGLNCVYNFIEKWSKSHFGQHHGVGYRTEEDFMIYVYQTKNNIVCVKDR